MTDIATAPSEQPMVRFGLATLLVKASDGVIDDVDVVVALACWRDRKSFSEEYAIEAAIPALEAVANRGTNAEVRAAAREHLVEAKQRLRQLRGE